MILRTTRFYHPTAAERVAEIAVQPATAPDGYSIRLARGTKAKDLANVTTTGPFTEKQLPGRLAETEQALRANGYFRAGVHALLTALQNANAQVRARAAARLGWMRATEAVDALIARLPNAVDDVCALIDALGAIGDSRAIAALRPHAARKLLSRRRSAVEALRHLNDAEGLAEARQQTLQRLPDPVRQAIEALDESTWAANSVESLTQLVLGLDVQQQGLALDTLYELATPLPVAVVRAALRKVPFDRPHLWRYVKSIHKRTLLRHDYVTFGALAHLIEVQARGTRGTTAAVKSGYDGVQRKTAIFRPKTQLFMRRLGWRYLRLLAKHQPDGYAHAAAEAIIHYTAADAQEPKGLHGAWASCYLLQRIVWNGGKRFVLDDRHLRFRFCSSKHVKAVHDVREEAFPELWDAQPRAFLRVLGASTLPEVHTFAFGSFLKSGKHQETLAAAGLAEILPLLQAPHQPTVALGLQELERRFDPQHPDWALLALLIADERPIARQLGQRFLRLSVALWARAAERIIDFLATPHGEIRALVVELCQPTLHTDAALRQTLAQRLLAILRSPEATEGAHEGYALLACESLVQELGALLTVNDLAEMVFRGSASAQAVAGELLRHRPEAVAELGLERLTAMAQHSLVGVREAAHGLLRSAAATLHADPAPLFVLVESDWADTRNLAFELLRTIDFSTLGFDGLLGLLDSNRVVVQDFGQEMARAHFPELKGDEMVFRVTQHPHRNMRRFALDLAEKHLPETAAALAEFSRFARTVLLDLWPQRRLKQRVIDFLQTRGLQDEKQAEVAADILGAFVRVQGRSDFERALEALVRIKLAFPDVEASVLLRPEGVA